jgi:hypothetical protein
MIPAQYIHSSGRGAISFYSDWQPREAFHLKYTVELADHYQNFDFKIEVYHKNSEDPGDGSLVSGSHVDFDQTDTKPTRKIGSADDLEELVRFKYTLTDQDGSPAWVFFRQLAPVWFNDVKV